MSVKLEQIKTTSFALNENIQTELLRTKQNNQESLKTEERFLTLQRNGSININLLFCRLLV